MMLVRMVLGSAPPSAPPRAPPESMTFPLQPCAGMMSRILLEAPTLPRSCVSTTVTVGTGGSAGSCTRQFQTTIFSFEVPTVTYGWHAGWQVAAATKLQSTISDTDGGGLDVVVHGLGLRAASFSSVSTGDYFVGTNDTTADTQLLSSSYVSAGVSAGSVAELNVSAYVRALVASALAAGVDPTGQFVTLRLSGQSLFGCDTNCDSACPIRRYRLPAAQTQLLLVLDPPADFPPAPPTTPPAMPVCLANEIKGSSGVCSRDDNYGDRAATVSLGGDGRLVYTSNTRGDTIPDFSYVGYEAGGAALPTAAHVPPTLTISAGAEVDDTPRIQAGIDVVSSLVSQSSGFRGCVQLGR